MKDRTRSRDDIRILKVTAGRRNNSSNFLAKLNGNFRFGFVVWIFQEPIIILSLKYPKDSFLSLCVRGERAMLWAKGRGVRSEETLDVDVSCLSWWSPRQPAGATDVFPDPEQRQVCITLWKGGLVTWICSFESGSCLRWLRKGFCLVAPLCGISSGGEGGFPERRRTLRWGRQPVGD